MADSLEIVLPDPVVYRTPTVWLVGQALKLLNTEGEAAEVGYGQVAELLRCRDDAVKVLVDLHDSTPREDPGLRWSALYVMGDVGDASAAEFLLRTAAESLPDPCKEDEGCEGPRDEELLNRTMAVAALSDVAARHEEVRENILALIAERPEQPVLIEALKAARELKLATKARELLNKDDYWMLDIGIRAVAEVMAKPERGDDTAVGYTPPNARAAAAAPAATCCSPKKEG